MTSAARVLPLQYPYLASSASFSSSSSSFQSAHSSPEPTPEPFDGSIFGSETSEDETYAKEEIARGKMISIQSYVVKPPAIPCRSELRRSQAMLLMPIVPETDTSMSEQMVEQEKYLSSEEDVSSAADDLSDCDFDSESEGSQDSIPWRSSGEIRARAVSVIYCGKPTIVDLPPRPRSVSPVLKSSRPLSRLRRKPAESCLSADLKASVPLRPSSMYNPVTTTRVSEKQGPLFLNTDPFESKEGSQTNEFARPMTPTALLKRTFTFNKKNKTAPAPATPQTQEGPSFARRRSESQVQLPASMSPSLSNYQDILRKARRIARVQTPPVTHSPLSVFSQK